MTTSPASAIESIVDLPPRAYPGLRPFRKNEWPVFFGRERMIAEVTARLAERHLLVVHGDSGCGKSSLIGAGVLPRLEHEAARMGTRWLTFHATPGDKPLLRLARALDGSAEDAPLADGVLALRRALNVGRDGISAVVELLEQRAPQTRFCLLIDQFEELFAHVRRGGRDEAAHLVDFLVGLHQREAGNLKAILTMRSEFLGACAQFRGFAETVNAAQYLLPRMEYPDLMRAIREPATLYGGVVDVDLAEQLIADAADVPDHLPLIQHGLMLLERTATRGGSGAAQGLWRLSLDSYRAHKKTLAELLSDSADGARTAAERALGTKKSNQVVEEVFRCLTDMNAEGQAIRRPRHLSEIAMAIGQPESSVHAVLEAFRADGVSLLRPYAHERLGEDPLLDISHEALIRYWKALAQPLDGWLAREFRDGLVWRSLLVQADSFEKNSKSLLSGSTTREREVWLRDRSETWAERYGGGWSRVQKLMSASVRQSRLSTIAAWSMVIAVLVMIVTMAALSAERSRALAASANARAEAEKRKTLLLSSVGESARVALLSAGNQTTDEALRKLLTQDAAEIAMKLQAVSGAGSVSIPPPAPSPPAPTPPVRVPPRVYVFYATEDNKLAAEDLATRIAGLRLGGDKIQIAAVQLKPHGDNTLRCFTSDDCAEAVALSDLLNGELATAVKLADYRFANAKALRPRHYELWLGPPRGSKQNPPQPGKQP